MVETANLMSVLMFLEEKSFTFEMLAMSLFTLSFTVFNGFLVVIGSAIYWVGITDIILAIISQRNLIIFWAILHEVDRAITFPWHPEFSFINIFNDDFWYVFA